MSIALTDVEKLMEVQTEICSLFDVHESWIEAATAYCEKYDLDEKELIPYLSQYLVDKITDEAIYNKTVKIKQDDIF